MTVKEFSQKYCVPEEKVWNFIKNLFDTAEKPFVKDENKYSASCKYILEELNFLIVDDVCTTASTIEEIAKLLKKNGAASVNGLTLARRTPYFS